MFKYINVHMYSPVYCHLLFVAVVIVISVSQSLSTSLIYIWMEIGVQIS